jgi:hypothetical protein
VSARFDEPNLVSCAGPAVGRACWVVCGRSAAGSACGLCRECRGERRGEDHLGGSGHGGCADSIDDLGVIRHGALPDQFGDIRAPSTLGTFLRGFTGGNVRQLDAVAVETLIGLSRNAPFLPGADSYAFLDVDSTINCVYGHANWVRSMDTPGCGDDTHCWPRSGHRSTRRSSPVCATPRLDALSPRRG